MELASSPRWERWLRFRQRFHAYSFHNQVLILAQSPAATQVAGYCTWQKVGRQVRRGQRGIAILAPLAPMRPELDRDALQLELDLPRVAFRVVRVFDVSQTEGPELPSPVGDVGPHAPGGSLPQLLRVAGDLGFQVQLEELRGGRRGDCSHALRRIRVDPHLSPGGLVKTMSHELAHALLHGPDFAGDRPLAELEAESVAYLVCHDLGIDSSAYSFGYVASWAGAGPRAAAEITAAASRITWAADRIGRQAAPLAEIVDRGGTGVS